MIIRRNAACARAVEESRVVRRISLALADTGLFPPGGVNVSTSDGIVRLRGSVTSYYKKQVAQAAALRIMGDGRLINDVEVDLVADARGHNGRGP